jgi:hypothetical protein
MSPEQFGRTSEARFILDAMLHGLTVSMPFSSMPGYDVIVHNGRRFWRVQVKGATVGKSARYTVNLRRPGRKVPQFDVCAVWLARENRWTFLPRSVRARAIVRLTPWGKFSSKSWEIFH